MKIAGFGTVRFSLISPDEAKLVQPEPNIDLSSKFLGILKKNSWILSPSKFICRFLLSSVPFSCVKIQFNCNWFNI